jgi:hypothetical protein
MPRKVRTHVSRPHDGFNYSHSSTLPLSLLEGPVRAAVPDEMGVRPRDISRCVLVVSFHSPTARTLLQALLRLLKHKPPPSVAAEPDRELSASSVVMDFEGVGNRAPVGSFYAGSNGGPSYGVVFGPSATALVDFDAGGSGNIANEPSGEAGMFFSNETDTYMTVASGFTGLSFQVASYEEGGFLVFDGPDGTGNFLASGTFSRTGVCGEEFDFPPCGDPTGAFGVWNLVTVPFSGVAKSVLFTGYYSLMILDDITIVPVVPPPCTRTTYWLWNPATDKAVFELRNNSARCIPVPYNLEVRPCSAPKKLPVFISLKNATSNGVIFNQNELAAPFYLWGDKTATKNVFDNKKPLPKGTYYLDSRVDGVFERIKFTKTC